MSTSRPTVTRLDVELADQCPVCLQDYQREETYICFDCDSAVCPFCVKIDSGEPLCPTCASDREEAS